VKGAQSHLILTISPRKFLRPGGRKLFHGRRGWHRSERFPTDLQLLLAGAILGALVAPRSRAV
jgi:hypothetical protein